MDADKIHALGCDLDDARTCSILDSITSLPSLALPVVCLPDLHMKERTEAPSSFAAATVDTIVPELTAPSVGCGMGALATSLTTKDAHPEFFKQFYEHMRGELGIRYGLLRNFFLWLGIIERPQKAYDLSNNEFEDLIRRGAAMAVEKYKLPKETLNHIEYEGSLFSHNEQKTLSLKNILPRISYRSGRHDLGYGFKGNHFLEIQYIENILDHDQASAWGLRENQIIVMYHGGGGAVSYHIGRYFANRKKNNFTQKLSLAIFKALFHFGSIRDWKYAHERWRYYFIPKPFTEIPTTTAEGTRLMDATKASLNYSYGFRIAMIKRISDSLRKTLPKKKIETRLIWDATHNSIIEEVVRGKRVIVHRHTANRVFDGKPIIISGFNTTNSYLGVGLPEAEEHLFSSDHGAGVTIKKMEAAGLSKEHSENYVTHIYQTQPPFKKVISHITNEGIDYVVQELEKAHIIKPVVRLRPLAVFKG